MVSLRIDSLGRVAAVVAGVFLVLPSAALPCLAGDCRLPAEEREGLAISSCCSRCDAEAEEQGSRSTIPDEKPEDAAPCECPPGCPAPCGFGKLPCPQAEDASLAAAPRLMRPGAEVSMAEPHSVTSAGVFHPPRY